MADGIHIELIGFDKLDRNLEELQLDGATGERILRKALRVGGEVVQAAIIERAPVRTEGLGGNSGNPAYDLPPGALKSDIEVHVTKDKETNSFAVYIEPGKYTKFVATMVEYGHNMVKGGRLFNWNKRGKGKHLGFVEAKPFVRPAWEESQAAAIAAVEETIGTEIAKAVEKLGG
jgi:Bacteriophage HK97-gp10, putative tail-component